MTRGVQGELTYQAAVGKLFGRWMHAEQWCLSGAGTAGENGVLLGAWNGSRGALALAEERGLAQGLGAIVEMGASQNSDRMSTCQVTTNTTLARCTVRR